MAVKNPIRQVVQNLKYEFQTLNTECLHFKVEINALIEERTNAENNKCKRRICQCLKLLDPLKPETSTYYKDKSKEILSMLHHISTHYDDLKKRYFWALDRLADMTIKLNYMTERQLKKEAQSKRLGKSWQDFCKDKEDDDEKYISSGKSTRVGDTDKLLGVVPKENDETKHKEKKLLTTKMKLSETKQNDETTQTEKKLLPMKNKLPENENEQERRKNFSRMFTKITKSPTLTKIEDISVVDESEYEDQLRSNIETSDSLSNVEKSKKHHKSNKLLINNELASASEIKMQIYALMAEVAERDELIDSLTSEIKVKDAQITQLIDVIRREKLGTKPKTQSKIQESDTFEQETE